MRARICRSLRLRLLLALGFLCTAQAAHAEDAPVDHRTAYDFSFRKLMGGAPLPLSDFRGKVLLVVNTASQCGFTPQYEGLETLFQTYSAQGLVILGVPSNDFGSQEPGTDDEIAHFCKLNYGVSFPMAAKEVVVGPGAHPFYIWARQSLGRLAVPRWNFHKYLIDRQGRLRFYFFSLTAPDSSRLQSAIEELLQEQPPG